MGNLNRGQAFKSACGGFFINVIDIFDKKVVYLFFNRTEYFYPSCRRRPTNPNRMLFVCDVQVTKPVIQLENDIKIGKLILLDQFFDKLPRLKSEYQNLV